MQEEQSVVMSQCLQLQQDMQDFRSSFKQQIQSVLDATPLIVKPRKTKVDLDCENTDCHLLPPPLLPVPHCQADV